MSFASSSRSQLPTITPQAMQSRSGVQPTTRRARPWRRNITPTDQLLAQKYEGAGTQSDPFIVDWLEEDIENPQHWKSSYKWGNVAIGALAVLGVAMASSMMSAAIVDIRKDFPGYSSEMYIMITSGFVLGFVVGPLIWAPCSEVFGRRNMFCLTFLPFTIFNAACCGANSLEALIVLRFLAGTFGASCLTSTGGIIADMFNAAERGSAMGLFAIAPFLGPAIGPIAGGFLSEASSWKWVAGLLAFFALILTIAGALFLPETYEPVLLRRRAKMLSKLTGDKYLSRRDAAKPLHTKELFVQSMKTPWILLFTEPIALLMALYMAVIYAILYMQFTSFPIVFQQYRGWSPSISGLAFIGLSVGSILGLVLLGIDNARYGKKLKAAGGYLPPEERLISVMLGACLLPAGLFMFAWTAVPITIHWIVPIIATVLFGAAIVGLFLGIMSYLVDTYILYSASALAGNTVLRSIFGVVLPLFTVRMYDSLGVSWAGSLIGFIALAFLPAPIIFFVYGSRIRRSCRFAREADDVGRALAARTKAAMGGEESQIQSRDGDSEVVHELARAVSAIPNPGVEPMLEQAEAAEKKHISEKSSTSP